MISSNTSIGCSPIKPSFKQNAEVLTATADWLESAQERGYDEHSFNTIDDITDKMSDGPLKTFTKIAGIAIAAGIAGKKGAQKAYEKFAKNATVNEKIFQPITKLVNKGYQKVSKLINESPLIGEQSIKGFVMTNLKKGAEAIETYAKKGTDTAVQEIDVQLNKIKESIIKSIKTSSTKNNKKLTEKQIVAELEKRLAGNSNQAQEYRKLAEQKELIVTDNLIKKVTGDTAALSAGTTAAVTANKDRDGDGIADIGQHKIED